MNLELHIPKVYRTSMKSSQYLPQNRNKNNKTGKGMTSKITTLPCHMRRQTGTSVISHALTQPLLPHLTGSKTFHVNRNYDRNSMGIRLTPVMVCTYKLLTHVLMAPSARRRFKYRRYYIGWKLKCLINSWANYNMRTFVTVCNDLHS